MKCRALLAIAVVALCVGCAAPCPLGHHTHRTVHRATKRHYPITVVAIRPNGITVRDQIGVLIDIPVRGHRYTTGDLNQQIP